MWEKGRDPKERAGPPARNEHKSIWRSSNIVYGFEMGVELLYKFHTLRHLLPELQLVEVVHLTNITAAEDMMGRLGGMSGWGGLLNNGHNQQ